MVKQSKTPIDGNLTLQQAKEQAAGMSMTRKAFVIQDGDKGCFAAYAPLPGVMFAYFQGKEVNVEKAVVKKEKPIKEIKVSESAKESAEPKDSNTSKQKTINKMKTTTKKSATKVAAKVTTKKSSEKKYRALDAPIKGGATLAILNLLKKGAITKEGLAKAAKTKLNNISWYLAKIKNNGYDVTLTDKGYKIAK